MTISIADDINRSGLGGRPGRTPERLRKRTRGLVAALREAVEVGRNWEEPLANLAVFLDQDVIPALTGHGRPAPVDLIAHAERLPLVQDPAEALLIAEHVEWLLHRPAQEATR